MKNDRYSRDFQAFMYREGRKAEVWEAVKFISKVIGGVLFFWGFAVLYLVTF